MAELFLLDMYDSLYFHKYPLPAHNWNQIVPFKVQPNLNVFTFYIMALIFLYARIKALVIPLTPKS